MTAAERAGGDAISPLIDALAARTGLDFTGSHQERMRNALEQASRDVGASSFDDYSVLVEEDPEVFAGLVERLRVGETYFFREPAQIEMVRAIVAAWADGADQRRVWSAGCATGEEPYTLAIVLEEAGVLERSRIIATDLSERALDRARAAVYGPWSLRRCEPEFRVRYFEERGGRHHLRPRLVDAVDFRQQNLLEGPPVGGGFDLVLCRNVLMYLHGDALRQAATVLRDALRPDGHLVVGSSDPRLAVDGLELVRSAHGLVYRRTIDHDRVRGAAAPVRPEPPRPEPASPPRTLRRHRPSRRAIDRAGTTEAAPSTPGDLVNEISALTAASDVAAAERLVASAITDHPLDAMLRVLDATLHLHAGRHADAAAAATAAVYLEQDLIVAHLLLGRIELQRGHRGPARRSLLTALELLAELPPTAEVAGVGGERAESLATTAAALVQATAGTT